MGSDAEEPQPLDIQQTSAGQLLRSTGPRILRDALGPTLIFFAGYKLFDLLVGVAAASVFAFGAYFYERRHGRPGLIARFVLALVVLQAVVGVVAHSATLYLVQPVVLDGFQATAWLGSVAIGRPLAGLFAREIFDFPEEVRASETFAKVFGRLSLVWGGYFLFAGTLQGVVLGLWGVNGFVVARSITSVGVAGLLAWSVRYCVVGFRESEEWGPAMEEAAAASPSAGPAVVPAPVIEAL